MHGQKTSPDGQGRTKEGAKSLAGTGRLKLHGQKASSPRAGGRQAPRSAAPAAAAQPKSADLRPSSDETEIMSGHGRAVLQKQIEQAVLAAEALPHAQRRQQIAALRLRWHPDKSGGVLPELWDTAMKMINAAVAESDARIAARRADASIPASIPVGGAAGAEVSSAGSSERQDSPHASSESLEAEELEAGLAGGDTTQRHPRTKEEGLKAIAGPPLAVLVVPEPAASATDAGYATNATLTSTALAYAFMYVSHVQEPDEVAARQRASSLQLQGKRALGRWSLDDLVDLFRIMIGRENIFTPKLWLERGRLWRLILLQRQEGYWDADTGLAFALLAHHTRPQKGKAHGTGKVGAGMLAAMTTAEDTDDIGDEMDDTAAAGVDDTAATGGGVLMNECPFTGYDRSAILWSIPDSLREAAVADEGYCELPVERIWTTMLAVRTLMSMHECFLLQARSGAHDSFDETVVDRAVAWLESVAADSPRLAAMMDGLLEEAQAYVGAWTARQSSLAKRTREAWTKQRGNRNALDVQRVLGTVAMAVRREHDTFSALLAPATGSVQRWQQLVLVMTALMGMLTVDIWMYEIRASACCLEARLMLADYTDQGFGCFDPAPAPCRGFTGDCSDLPLQFSDLPPQLNPFAGYTCHQFPDPVLGTLCSIPDKLIVSLIMVAVALPTRMVIGRIFELSNLPAGVDDSLWLRHLGMVKLITGKISWHYAAGKTSRVTKNILKYGNHWDTLFFKFLQMLLRKVWRSVYSAFSPRRRLRATVGNNAAPGDGSTQQGGDTQQVAATKRLQMYIMRMAARDEEEESIARNNAAHNRRGFDGAHHHHHGTSGGHGTMHHRRNVDAATQNGDVEKRRSLDVARHTDEAEKQRRSLDVKHLTVTKTRGRSGEASQRQTVEAAAHHSRGKGVATDRMWPPATALASPASPGGGASPGGSATRERTTRPPPAPSTGMLQRWLDRYVGGAGAAQRLRGRGARGDLTSEAHFERTLADAASSRQLSALGLMFVYGTWFLLVWFALVYGSLIYQLLGDRAQEQFSYDWAVGIGLDQATQWQSVVQSAVQAAILLTLLDRLNLVTSMAWLEGYVDQASVQATMLFGAGGAGGMGLVQRTAAHMQLMMRIEAK